MSNENIHQPEEECGVESPELFEERPVHEFDFLGSSNNEKKQGSILPVDKPRTFFARIYDILARKIQIGGWAQQERRAEFNFKYYGDKYEFLTLLGDMQNPTQLLSEYIPMPPESWPRFEWIVGIGCSRFKVTNFLKWNTLAHQAVYLGKQPQYVGFILNTFELLFDKSMAIEARSAKYLQKAKYLQNLRHELDA